MDNLKVPALISEYRLIGGGWFDFPFKLAMLFKHVVD